MENSISEFNFLLNLHDEIKDFKINKSINIFKNFRSLGIHAGSPKILPDHIIDLALLIKKLNESNDYISKIIKVNLDSNSLLGYGKIVDDLKESEKNL